VDKGAVGVGNLDCVFNLSGDGVLSGSGSAAETTNMVMMLLLNIFDYMMTMIMMLMLMTMIISMMISMITGTKMMTKKRRNIECS